MRRPAVAVLVLAAIVAVAGLGSRPADGAAAATVNHAAIVVDTSDGKVRKFCLAFPEESITGAEALRRIESEAVFATYGGKGQAVCSLCGVGCPSGDCFCDRSKFWAYHRAGPGGAPYEYSRAGASATTVRDGDVEGWKWGTGAAPPAGTVGEICGVDEPPVRAASSGSGGTSTTTTAPVDDDGPTASTTSPPADATTATTAAPAAGIASPRAVAPTRPSPPAPAVAGPGSSDSPAPSDAPSSQVTAPADPAAPASAEPEDLANPGPETDPADLPEEAAGPTPERSEGPRAGALIGPVAFVVLLGGILLWRARLRRGNVRRAATLR